MRIFLIISRLTWNSKFSNISMKLMTTASYCYSLNCLRSVLVGGVGCYFNKCCGIHSINWSIIETKCILCCCFVYFSFLSHSSNPPLTSASKWSFMASRVRRFTLILRELLTIQTIWVQNKFRDKRRSFQQFFSHEFFFLLIFLVWLISTLNKYLSDWQGNLISYLSSSLVCFFAILNFQLSEKNICVSCLISFETCETSKYILLYFKGRRFFFCSKNISSRDFFFHKHKSRAEQQRRRMCVRKLDNIGAITWWYSSPSFFATSRVLQSW